MDRDFKILMRVSKKWKDPGTMPQMTVTTVVTDFKHLRFTVTFNISATSKCLHLVSADLC